MGAIFSITSASIYSIFGYLEYTKSLVTWCDLKADILNGLGHCFVEGRRTRHRSTFVWYYKLFHGPLKESDSDLFSFVWGLPKDILNHHLSAGSPFWWYLRVQRLELNHTFCLYPVLGGLVLCCLFLISVSDDPRLGHFKSGSLMLEPGDYGLLLCLPLRSPRLFLSWRHQFDRTACILSLTPVCVSLKEAFASPLSRILTYLENSVGSQPHPPYLSMCSWPWFLSHLYA